MVKDVEERGHVTADECAKFGELLEETAKEEDDFAIELKTALYVAVMYRGEHSKEWKTI